MDGPLLRKSIDVRTLKQSFDLEDFCWLELGVVCMPAMFDFYYCPKLRVKHCQGMNFSRNFWNTSARDQATFP